MMSPRLAILSEKKTSAKDILAAHPAPSTADASALAECVGACFECAQVCTACADARLRKRSSNQLAPCIRTDVDCADAGDATGRVLSRQTQPSPAILRAQVQSCHVACRASGDECEKHGDMDEHCRRCVETGRRCERACERLMSAMPAA